MVTLDTHAVVKRLIAVGFTDEQAEAVTFVVRDAQDVDLSNLATKADLDVLKSDVAVLKSDVAVLKSDVAVLKSDVAVLKSDVAVLKTDMAGLKTDVGTLRTNLAETKAEILKWMMGTMGIQTVIIISAVVALLRMASH